MIHPLRKRNRIFYDLASIVAVVLVAVRIQPSLLSCTMLVLLLGVFLHLRQHIQRKLEGYRESRRVILGKDPPFTYQGQEMEKFGRAQSRYSFNLLKVWRSGMSVFAMTVIQVILDAGFAWLGAGEGESIFMTVYNAVYIVGGAVLVIRMSAFLLEAYQTRKNDIEPSLKSA